MQRTGERGGELTVSFCGLEGFLSDESVDWVESVDGLDAYRTNEVRSVERPRARGVVVRRRENMLVEIE